MSRMPKHILRANRAQADANANAQFYNAVGRGQYKLDLNVDGRAPISIDIRDFVRENPELTPAERRRIREMRAGDELNVGGGAGPVMTIFCIVPQESHA